MTRILSILCAAVMSCGWLHAQQKTPGLEAVNKAFYKKYNLYSLEVPYLSYEKRLQEWYVVTYSLVDGFPKRKTAYQFYDGNTYRELPDIFAQNDDPMADNDIPAVEAFDISNYGLQPYYGYPGWYNDVAKYYAGHTPVNDSNNYALARAYSTMANAMISDQYGDALPRECFNPPMKNDCLSPVQLRKYDSVCRLAIDQFRKVMDINPAYQTIVGPIRVKYANEMMVPFHNRLTYAGKETQTYTLPDNIYTDSVLAHNRKVLQECPKDAVLLSMGDNDFYPVLYLQQREGLRKDVYLINLSLMGMDRYLFRYQYPQFEARAIDLHLDSSMYYGHLNDYIRIDGNAQERTLHMKDLETILREGKGDNVISPGTLIIREASGNKKAIEFALNSGYLYKNNWSLLLLLHHLGNRKLCTQYPFYDILTPLNNNLQEQGAILVLE